jgi:hypothetical protein
MPFLEVVFMHANFSLLNHVKPDLSALSDTALERWGQEVARRQKRRSRALKVLRAGAILAGFGVGIGMIAYAFSSIVLPLSYMVGPAGLGLILMCAEGAHRCKNQQAGPDMVRLNEELLRRKKLAPSRATGPAIVPATAPSPTEDFAAAVHNGVADAMTVGRPLKLVRRAQLMAR